MSRELTLIPREMSLPAASRLLARAQVSGAPVVDDQGRCIGVLSVTDLAHATSENAQKTSVRRDTTPCHCAWQFVEIENLPAERVDAFMTKDPVTVTPGTSIYQLAKLMVDAHIHRVIVVNAEQRAIGLVSSTDLLAAIANLDEPTPPRVPESRHKLVFG
jgi:CBS domain-containing protein